ncbi:MAG TPA: type I restriction enzyme HsdR N-terminal domain-containing protein [Bacteroidales bacterium]|nr:type I restriction enzyme HsdR N-terminal domain-containing protein [Bacteroidales bacterium]HSA43478.1 type I restriction enzyme HsdR N-terminal domain-containing protein [Bacteroidales bacterium]
MPTSDASEPYGLPQLNFPPAAFRFGSSGDVPTIFDPFRKKYVALSREEWVRQHILAYLTDHLHYPAGLICVEKSLILNRMAKRADILVYNRLHRPAMLVECKAPEVALTRPVFEQIARYNLVFRVSFLLVTNGLDHYVFHVSFETGALAVAPEIPPFEALG